MPRHKACFPFWKARIYLSYYSEGHLTVSIPSDRLFAFNACEPRVLILPRCRQCSSKSSSSQGTCMPASTHCCKGTLQPACLSVRAPSSQADIQLNKMGVRLVLIIRVTAQHSHKVRKYPHIGSIVPVKGLASLIRSIIPF